MRGAQYGDSRAARTASATRYGSVNAVACRTGLLRDIVLFINTVDTVPIVSKEEYVDARWWLDSAGIEGVKAVGSAREPLMMQIKGHGNSTWTGREKKPYRLKFSEKHKILGMPSSRHFVLLATAGEWMGKNEQRAPL